MGENAYICSKIAENKKENMDRKTFIKSSGMLALGSMALGMQACNGKQPSENAWKDELWKGVKPTAIGDFPLHDLHIHASASL